MPDGKRFTWEKEYYIDKCYILSQDETSPYYNTYKCETFIENVKHRDESLFLGAAWMLKYYAVFDLDQKQVGMAKNRDNPTMSAIKSKAIKNTRRLL